MPKRALPIVGLLVAAACSTGDPDPDPADPGNRIQRTTVKVDSALNPARDHMHTIETLGAEE